MSWENTVRLVHTAPVTPEGMAEDLIYAFAHGWIDLPVATAPGEAGERLTRLYAVRRHVERNRYRQAREALAGDAE